MKLVKDMEEIVTEVQMGCNCRRELGEYNYWWKEEIGWSKTRLNLEE